MQPIGTCDSAFILICIMVSLGVPNGTRYPQWTWNMLRISEQFQWNYGSYIVTLFFYWQWKDCRLIHSFGWTIMYYYTIYLWACFGDYRFEEASFGYTRYIPNAMYSFMCNGSEVRSIFVMSIVGRLSERFFTCVIWVSFSDYLLVPFLRSTYHMPPWYFEQGREYQEERKREVYLKMKRVNFFLPLHEFPLKKY